MTPDHQLHLTFPTHDSITKNSIDVGTFDQQLHLTFPTYDFTTKNSPDGTFDYIPDELTAIYLATEGGEGLLTESGDNILTESN